MGKKTHQKLAVFRSDLGITLSFGPNTYFVDSCDPFYNIALKAIGQDDYVPFYIEIAKREGLGREFRDSLMSEIENLSEDEN